MVKKAQMFKKVYSLYSALCTQPAFYSQSAVCLLHPVCILPLVRSLQSAVRSLRFTLTGFMLQKKYELNSKLIRIILISALADG